jgi:hypothetical protein
MQYDATHRSISREAPAQCQKYRQLASLVQKGDPGKLPSSAQFCTIRRFFAMPASQPGKSAAPKRARYAMRHYATCSISREPCRCKRLSAIGFFQKFPQAPFGEKPYPCLSVSIRVHPCPSVVPSWRCESACIGVHRRFLRSSLPRPRAHFHLHGQSECRPRRFARSKRRPVIKCRPASITKSLPHLARTGQEGKPVYPTFFSEH